MVHSKGIRVKKTVIVSKNKNGGKTLAKKVAATGGYKHKMYNLDAAARNYMRILADPCGADLTKPVYAGTDSGYLMRIRYRFNIGVNTDFAIQCVPNRMQLATGLLSTASTGGTGLCGPVDAVNGNYLTALTGLARSLRPVAACLKAVYIGSESARSGEIGMAIIPEQIINDATSYTPGNFLLSCPTTQRTGMEAHEIRWAPTNDDQSFCQIAADPVNYTPSGGAILLVGVGCPASSVIIEFTGVYEWLPAYAKGVTAAYAPPGSANTLNDVLRALGPAADWAYGKVKERVITSIANPGASVKNIMSHTATKLAFGALGL